MVAGSSDSIHGPSVRRGLAGAWRGGNYHNAGPRGRVAAETVHFGDVEGLARLFERMARDTRRVDAVYATAQRRWRRIGREAARRLRAGE